MKSTVLTITFLSALFAHDANAESAFVKVPELKCPDKLDLAFNQKLNKAPKGWRKFVDKTNFYLDHVNFYSGAPEGSAMLKPEDDGTVTFARKDGWIACVYQHTVVQVTRKIPDPYSNCRAVFVSKETQDKNPLLGPIDSIECR